MSNGRVQLFPCNQVFGASNQMPFTIAKLVTCNTLFTVLLDSDAEDSVQIAVLEGHVCARFQQFISTERVIAESGEHKGRVAVL